MTNEEILTKMEEEIHLRGLSHHTREEYITRAKLTMQYFNRSLKELTEQDLREFILYLLNEKKFSSGSFNGYNSAIRFDYGYNYCRCHDSYRCFKSINFTKPEIRLNVCRYLTF